MTILYFIIVLALFVSVVLFIKINDVLFDEYASERKSIKESISKWYKGTRLFMWSNNRKNGVTILSEKEYHRLLEEGKIKYVVIEEES